MDKERMCFKPFIVRLTSSCFSGRKWKKFISNCLNGVIFYSVFPFARKVEKYNLLIIDDFFPLPNANTWRSKEFHEYFKQVPSVRCLNIPGYFTNKFMSGQPSGRYDEKLRSYLTLRPENEAFISQIQPHVKYRANLAYLLFFNNVSLMLPWLESNQIPFVFCLYPGGGFCPENKERDGELRKIFDSTMFRSVIVTQNFTRDYLIQHNFCRKDNINFIFGGLSQISPEAIQPKQLFGIDKKTFDICFVGHKYDENGLRKGFDIFIEVAKKISEQNSNIHFHIVGNWEEDSKAYSRNPNIHFMPVKNVDFFPEFYAGMDIFITPNRSHRSLRQLKTYTNQAPIEFDGFPLGLDAGICGTALFVTDELGHTTGYFNDEEDIVIINHDVDFICGKIIFYYKHKEELYCLSNKQRKKMTKLFNTEIQIKQRLDVLNQFLEK
jgi:glycosyltransferase involved in cell wall biosynthesis